MFEKYSSLIFDYDLTIVDSYGAIEDGYIDLIQKNGGDPSNFKLAPLFGMKDTEAITYTYNLTRPHCSLEHFISEVHGKEPLFSNSAPLIVPPEFFQKLAVNKKLFIVTNNRRQNIVGNVADKNIETYFSEIVTADDFEPHTKTEGIISLIEKFDLEKKETLYIGDHVNDIIYSKKAGIDILAVGTGLNSESELRELNPDYFVDSLKSLHV